MEQLLLIRLRIVLVLALTGAAVSPIALAAVDGGSCFWCIMDKLPWWGSAAQVAVGAVAAAVVGGRGLTEIVVDNVVHDVSLGLALGVIPPRALGAAVEAQIEAMRPWRGEGNIGSYM